MYTRVWGSRSLVRPVAQLLEHGCSINTFKINGWARHVYVINITHPFLIDPLLTDLIRFPQCFLFSGIDNAFLFQLGHSAVN